MKKQLALVIALCIGLFAAGALADSMPMTAYTAGQMIDVGFAKPVAFLAGCVLESGKGFMLVDTEDYGAYLLEAKGRLAEDTITLAMPVPDGYSAEVTAQDEHHCIVRVWNNQESHAYTFAYEPTEKYEEPWKIKTYERRTAGNTFSVQLSLDRAQAKQTTNAGMQAYTTYYQFFAEANNINYAKIPGSMEELKQLEVQYPVAAVSPDDPTTRVNLREGPGTSYPRCGSLYSGALLRIREIKNGWAKIHVGDTDAYISTEFLTFGAAIESVPDMRPRAALWDGDWIQVSRAPYRGGGGTVFQQPGGQEVRIMGEYNNQWRIVSANPGSYYVHIDDLK